MAFLKTNGQTSSFWHEKRTGCIMDLQNHPDTGQQEIHEALMNFELWNPLPGDP